MQKHNPIAILLIPDMEFGIRMKDYYKICRDKIIEEGYVIINPLSYYAHKEVVNFEYLKSVKDCINAIFVFIDFAPNNFILKVENEFSGLIKERKIEEEYLDYIQAGTDGILINAIDRAKDYFKITISLQDLIGNSRKRELVQTRQFIMKKIKESTELPLSAVGLILNRDHSTVVYAIKTIDNTYGMIDEYHKFWGEILKIKSHNQPNLSIIAELEMRKRNYTFQSPAIDITPKSHDYSGYREHSF